MAKISETMASAAYMEYDVATDSYRTVVRTELPGVDAHMERVTAAELAHQMSVLRHNAELQAYKAKFEAEKYEIEIRKRMVEEARRATFGTGRSFPSVKSVMIGTPVGVSPLHDRWTEYAVPDDYGKGVKVAGVAADYVVVDDPYKDPYRDPAWRDRFTGAEIYRAPEGTKVVCALAKIPVGLTAIQWAIGETYKKAKEDGCLLASSALEMSYSKELVAYYKAMGLPLPDRLVPAGEDWNHELTDAEPDTDDEEVELWG